LPLDGKVTGGMEQHQFPILPAIFQHFSDNAIHGHIRDDHRGMRMFTGIALKPAGMHAQASQGGRAREVKLEPFVQECIIPTTPTKRRFPGASKGSPVGPACTLGQAGKSIIIQELENR
jgi:hypothetical protein